jgi:import inner membrane translocase subunit TIM21
VNTSGHLLFVLSGATLGGFLLWGLGNDLLSSNSPNNVFKDAIKRLNRVTALTQVLGTPLQGEIQLEHRSRRRTVAYTITPVGKNEKMKMQFYCIGPNGVGTVHLDLIRQDEHENWQYHQCHVDCQLNDGSQKHISILK